MGLLQALLRLGCYHTAQTYIAGAQGTATAAAVAGEGGAARMGGQGGMIGGIAVAQGQQQQGARSNEVNNKAELQLTDMQLQLAWRLADWEALGQQSRVGIGSGDGGSRNGCVAPGVNRGSACDWSTAAGLAATAMLQLRDVVLQQQQRGQVQGPQLAAAAAAEPFHASVLLLLQHLAAGEVEGFRVQLQRCSLAAVTRLTSHSHQSAAAVNPALLQLQMLEMVRRAWLLLWSNQRVTGSSSGAIGQSLAAVDLLQQLLSGCGVAPIGATAGVAGQISQSLTSSSSSNSSRAVIPPSATAMSMYDYSLTDQLLSLQGVLLSILRRWVPEEHGSQCERRGGGLQGEGGRRGASWPVVTSWKTKIMGYGLCKDAKDMGCFCTVPGLLSKMHYPTSEQKPSAAPDGLLTFVHPLCWPVRVQKPQIICTCRIRVGCKPF